MHVPRATCASEWIVTFYFGYENSSDPGSHHIGLQADTVRSATINPILSQGQFGIKPAPQYVLFHHQVLLPLPLNHLKISIVTMCKHEMLVMFSISGYTHI